MAIKDKYTVMSIKKSETKEWLLRKHYAHRVPPISYAFGLYDDKTLVGVCTFGMPASPSLCFGIAGEEYRNNVLELNRLCLQNNVYNEASFFIGRCLHLIKVMKIIVSYSDTGHNHVGYIYQATNWIYTGITKERTDIYAGDGKHSRHYKSDTSKRQIRTAKHRYVYLIGTKKEKKRLLGALKYPILPYPKGDNKRYDAGYEPIIQNVLDL